MLVLKSGCFGAGCFGNCLPVVLWRYLLRQGLFHTCVMAAVVMPFANGAETPLHRGDQSSPPVVGLVLHGLENPVYQKLEEQARLFCKSGGGYCRLLSGGPLGEREVATQKQWMRQLLAEKVNGLVIAPISSRSLVPVLIDAKKRGVRMVNIGSRLDPELLSRNRLIIPWVGPDNGAAARCIAQLLVDRLGADKSVAILAGPPGELASFERVSAAKGVLRKAGLKVVAVESGQWDATLAQEKVMALMCKHPDLSAVFSASDAMALGAMRAADLKNRKLLITGFGGDSRVLDFIRAGRILATVDWYPDRQGVYAIEKLFAGTPGDKKTPWRLLTRQDL